MPSLWQALYYLRRDPSAREPGGGERTQRAVGKEFLKSHLCRGLM